MGVLTPEQYEARLDQLYERVLKTRIIETLESLTHDFREAGYTTEGPFDLTDDEYRWYIVVDGNGLPEPVDVTLEVTESTSYGDGTEGINIGLSIVAEGGLILGGLAPYNYSPEVWADVRDEDAIIYRMQLIETAATFDAPHIVALVDEYKED